MSLPLSIDRAGPGVRALWAELDGNRLAWAFRAYECFVQSLSPEIRERLAHKGHQDEAYVVVFGNTQVGKTTLLMDLMGVSADAMGRVSAVLRGGRESGKSATATAMEYRRSPDQRWGLRVKLKEETHWFDDDSAITLALGDLRKAMERRDLVADEPCVVSIPADCFAQSADQEPAVRMLDLPGDKPSNPTEQAHVHEMARRYVPLADLILLVGRGDSLAFLQPGNLTLPGIEDWQTVPRRFRIITTFSFLAESVRELVRQHHGPADASMYRARLIEQIERFGPLSKEARTPELYFPLEFGASWLATKEKSPDLYERVQPMLDELKRQLHEDIRASTTQRARLEGAVDAHVVIARVRENKKKEAKATLKTLYQQRKAKKGDQLAAKNVAERVGEECQRMKCRLSMLTETRLGQELEKHCTLSPIQLGDPDKTVSGFKWLIATAKSSLARRLEACRINGADLKDTAWFWRGIRVSHHAGTVSKILEDVFGGFEERLDGYVLDKYWRTEEGSDYQEDQVRLRRCIRAAESALVETVRGWWLDAAQRHLVACQNELKEMEMKHESWLQQIEEMNGPILEMKRKSEKCLERFREIAQDLAEDMEKSQRFISLLDNQYLAELQQRRQAILTEERAEKAFVHLLAAVQLKQVREQLLLCKEPASA